MQLLNLTKAQPDSLSCLWKGRETWSNYSQGREKTKQIYREPSEHLAIVVHCAQLCIPGPDLISKCKHFKKLPELREVS